MFTKHDSRNFFHWHHGIITNLVKLIRREQVERWTSTFHSGQAPEVHFQIFGFPWCSSSKNLSIDVSITNLGLMLTKLMWFKLCQKSKFEFPTFSKKNQILGFPWCSTCEDLSIDVSITNVGLILTKLKWFQLCQKSKFKLFWKKF